MEDKYKYVDDSELFEKLRGYRIRQEEKRDLANEIESN